MSTNVDPHPETPDEIEAFRAGFDAGYDGNLYCNPYREWLWRKYDAGFVWGRLASGNPVQTYKQACQPLRSRAGRHTIPGRKGL